MATYIVTILCDVNDAPLLPLSLDPFPENFRRTRAQVVARDTWFPKNRLFRVLLCTLFVLSLRVTGNVLRRRNPFHPPVEYIPPIYLT